MAKVEKEKSKQMYQLNIMFNSKESSVFGGIQAQSVSIVVDAETRNKALDMYYGKNGIIAVTLNENLTRHINASNILYIDEVILAQEEQGKEGGKDGE